MLRKETKKKLWKIYEIILLIFIAYVIYELIRKILGGSLTIDELIAIALTINITFTFYLQNSISKMKDSLNKVDIKISRHIGWHKGKARKH